MEIYCAWLGAGAVLGCMVQDLRLADGGEDAALSVADAAASSDAEMAEAEAATAPAGEGPASNQQIGNQPAARQLWEAPAAVRPPRSEAEVSPQTVFCDNCREARSVVPRKALPDHPRALLCSFRRHDLPLQSQYTQWGHESLFRMSHSVTYRWDGGGSSGGWHTWGLSRSRSHLAKRSRSQPPPARRCW